MNKIIREIRSSSNIQSILVWSVVFIMLFVQSLWVSVEVAVLTTLITLTCLLVIYYSTQLILIPRLFLKEKKVIYTVLSIFIIVVLAALSAKFEIFVFKSLKIQPEKELLFVFSVSKFLFLYICVYAISNIIFFSNKTKEDSRQKKTLLSEKKMLEIRVLKSQINSHFIFNALNNIYSMIYFKDESTAGYVLKLAQMMRYVMEDCETELTPLSKEIEYIENFIDFQKLRFEDDKDIVFTCNIEGNSNLFIPPMIFQPLVENCFKHTSIEADKNSYIHILLQIREENIFFISENKQSLTKNKQVSDQPGIGIENVKRRLELYFSDRHNLQITDGANCFKVELSINLQ